MKKILSLMAILFIFSQTGFAQFTGTSDVDFTSVSNLKSAKDGDYVALTGSIQSKVGNEKYLFKDSTGMVTVEIDDKDWNGLNVNADDKVIIEGEVDKDFGAIKIDVDSVRLSK